MKVEEENEYTGDFEDNFTFSTEISDDEEEKPDSKEKEDTTDEEDISIDLDDI